MATVVLVETESGDKAILKDFSRSSWLFRLTFGALLIAREARAYRRLEAVSGIPRLIGMVKGRELFLEYVPGSNCIASPPHAFSQDFFDQALVLLAEVRARGVLHFDVGGNLVLGLDGRPWLVDFGSCLSLPPWLGGFGRRLADLRGKYDERALLKLKRRRAPQLLTPSEAEKSTAVLPFESWIKIAERLVKRTVAWMSG